ncbi:MAG: H+transporting two-sector ATPase C subunit [Sphingobacteriia bacterium]|nr:H+transporting two-sector ATPase C subunit [Sphingobacteriia bacterium]NCC37917.1 H+transporting two-sector ATPase C subunit [Gammaproteobacteria bacterium]
MKASMPILVLTVAGVALLTGIAGILVWQPAALANTDAGVLAVAMDPHVLRWGFMAAALVTAVATIAAAYAVATVGAAAVGALTEKPELFGRMVILVGLAEGIAIYGVIVSVLILNRLG